jgi:hypothetical protein
MYLPGRTRGPLLQITKQCTVSPGSRAGRLFQAAPRGHGGSAAVAVISRNSGAVGDFAAEKYKYRGWPLIPIAIVSRRCGSWSIRLAVLLLAAGAHAEAPRIFAITNVRIVTAPGETIDRGTVVMRDGLIEAVGAKVEAPPDARVFAGEEGWTVYPAFIDAASVVGLETEAPAGPPRPGQDAEQVGVPHELKSVHPQAAVVDELNFGHASLERHHELGFAVAQVLPGNGVFRGESAVIALREAPAQELIMVPRMAQVIALEKSSFMAREYPSSSIGAVATVRQTLLDAQRQLIWNERYAANPGGMEFPEYRASDPPLLAMLRDERPVVFVCLAGLDPGRFQAIADEFRLRGMTVATGLGQRLDGLRASRMPILLPLELPEKPALADADELQDAKMGDLQAYVRAPRLPAQLAVMDKEFAFVTAGMKTVRDFPVNLAAVVAAGLPRDRALAAVTTVPARLLGLDLVIGTIEPGKQANLFVVQGDLFTDKPEFRHFFVDGYHTAAEEEEIIGDPNAVVDPRGTWEIITEVMGRSSDSTWTISGSPDSYQGFSESSSAGKRDFKRLRLKGNALTVTSDTPRGEFEVTVVINGDTLAGETTMESPRGSAKMEIEGRRVAPPEEQR